MLTMTSRLAIEVKTRRPILRERLSPRDELASRSHAFSREEKAWYIYTAQYLGMFEYVIRSKRVGLSARAARTFIYGYILRWLWD